jgi:hypothetical protein
MKTDADPRDDRKPEHENDGVERLQALTEAGRKSRRGT